MAAKFLRWLVVWSVIVGVMAPAPAFAQDLTFSATADKTSINTGEPMALTFTLAGNLEGAKLSELQLPDGFTIAAQSQATNFTIRGGAAERSTNLTYVLIAQQLGTFQLGPFTVTQGKQEFQTQAIEITVKKSALPPPSKVRPEGERYTL